MTIRRGTLADYPHYERLWAQLAVHDPALGQRWWGKSFQDTLFAEEDGATIGYVYAYPLSAEGHVSQLVVDAGVRGRGVGRALMDGAAARLRQQGCVAWSLDVTHDNAPALALYRRCGMTARYASEIITLPWEGIDALPSDEAGTVVATLDPMDDGEFERTFDVPLGSIKRVRRLPGRVYAMARCSGAPCGVVAFDPVTGSTALLRARTPATARLLLEAIRTTRAPEQPSVRVHIEDDPTLSAAMTNAGGRTLMQMIRMAGVLGL